MVWQLQEAKQKFSEVVRRALSEGPQIVTRHETEVVVVLSVSEFERLREDMPDFKEFLLSAPDLDRLDIRREEKPARRVEF
jgi:prevent-host-death family protein